MPLDKQRFTLRELAGPPYSKPDPTAMTPSADVMGVASSGLLGVLGDARCTFTEGLKAILVAELADNDGLELAGPGRGAAGPGRHG